MNVTPSGVEIGILPYQLDFLQSTATHTGLVAGYGAGKSRIGTLKTIEKKKAYPGIDVAYYLPTYQLVKDIAFVNFEEVLKQMHIPFDLNRTDHAFNTPLGRIIMRSMDNPESIIGYEVGYSLIDETDLVPKLKMERAFKNIVARNRVALPDGSVNMIDAVSTPEGFAFMYDFFVKNKKQNRHLIKANARENPFLPDSYFDTLLSIYTAEQVRAYIGGEFVNLTSGMVFRMYRRERNDSPRTIVPGDRLFVGIDFNITNMSAVFHVIDGKYAHAVDEITGAYDTAELIELIKKRYPQHRIIIDPDQSGKNRNTAGPSDIKLLKEGGFRVRTSSRNPGVKDRITTTNAALFNAKGEVHYFVNSDTCPEYAEALEKLPYKNAVPDKTSGYDHITDAGTYSLYKIMQLKGRVRITAG